MAIEASSVPRRHPSAAAAFWWRLTDNAFRRLPLLLLPVLLLTALGIKQASNTIDVYQSTGVLSTSSNPLLPDQLNPGAAGTSWWESPASASSRTINEQLRTDAFIEDVASRAGLTDAVDTGIVRLDVIRNNVGARADGNSLVKVSATWGDPQTTLGLVEGTIAAYQDFLAETVASDSSEAVSFYTSQVELYREEVETAQQNLESAISALPPLEVGEERPVTADLRIQRLTDVLTAAEADLAATEDKIEAAELAVAQSRSAAGRSMTLIDAPKLPTAPVSTMLEQVKTMVSFLLFGIVIAAGALLVTTVLDHSVSSTHDLVGLDGVALVVAVPTLRLAPGGANARSRKRRFRSRGHQEQSPEPETVGV